MVTPSGDLVVLAVQRSGADLGPSEPRWLAGDTLLLQGTWKALDRTSADPRCWWSTPPTGPPPGRADGPGREAALGVLVAMVVLLATGLVPPAVAGLLAAGA